MEVSPDLSMSGEATTLPDRTPIRAVRGDRPRDSSGRFGIVGPGMEDAVSESRARLYRSRNDRVIAGIGGGLGRYLGVDPVLIRIAIVVLAVLGGGGVLAYLIGWVAIPEEPAPGVGATAPPGATAGRGGGRLVLGTALVAVGLGLLLQQLAPNLPRVMWPVALIATGAVLLFHGVRR